MLKTNRLRDTSKGFQNWDQQKEAFKYWAERIKTFLDEAHGEKK